MFSLQFAPRGLNPFYTSAGHRLTSRSRGTRCKQRAPELQRSALWDNNV
jgi:hypothetical protein